jgi:hypothetical protein
MIRPSTAGTIVALAAALCACGRTSADNVESSTAKRQVVLSKQASNVPAQTPRIESSLAAQSSAETQRDTESWPVAVMQDPDASVRLLALETWAQNPGETLDPVTYALVDPDETVRTRAQALLEEALVAR